MSMLKSLRSDFVATHDERHLPAPRVHKGGPGGVDSQILSIPGTHSQRRVLKRLSCKLQHCGETNKRMSVFQFLSLKALTTLITVTCSSPTIKQIQSRVTCTPLQHSPDDQEG